MRGELREYLKKYSNSREVDVCHAQIVHAMDLLIPQIVAGEHQVYKNVVLIQKSNPREEKGRIDLVALTCSETYIIKGSQMLETKSNRGVKNTKYKLDSQLRNTREFFQGEFGINPIMIRFIISIPHFQVQYKTLEDN